MLTGRPAVLLCLPNSAATIKLSALRALAAGADGDALRSSVPRFSLTEPVEEDPIKIGIVGGTGTISTAIVSRLLAMQQQLQQAAGTGGRIYDIVCINRGITSSASPYPDGVRHLRLDRQARREEFERVCAAEMFEWVIDMVCYTPEDALSSIRAFAGRGNPLLSHFVFCSTADVYGTQLEWIPVCEDHPTRPVGRYGKAKLAAEQVFQAHAHANANANAASAGQQGQQGQQGQGGTAPPPVRVRAFPLTIMRPASVYGEVGSSATLLDPLGRGDGQWVDDMRAGRSVVVPGTEGTLTQFMVRLLAKCSSLFILIWNPEVLQAPSVWCSLYSLA
jgi:hypothetical protein